jgi:hypothetical protein
VQHDRKSSGLHAIFLGVCFLVRAALLVQRSGPFNKNLKEKMMNLYPLDASLSLAEAGPKWLQQHGRMLKENTTRNYRAALGLLNKSFGDLCLRDIDVAQFRLYQQARGEVAGAYLINSGSEQASVPQGQVPNFENSAMQAEIDRRVALAMETRRAKFRTPERPLSRRLTRSRRLAMSGTRERLEARSGHLAPNVVSFPGPKRA